MEDFKIIAELGFIPFSESRIVYVGKDSDNLNKESILDMEMRRCKYMQHLISLGVDPNGQYWNRLTGKELK